MSTQQSTPGIVYAQDLQVGDHIQYNAYSVLTFIGEVIALAPMVEIEVESARTYDGLVNLASTGTRTIPPIAFAAGQVHRLD